jgi:hypothetical protein
MPEYGGISRNMPEYHGIWRNITEYGGISRNMAEYHGIWRNITEYHDIFPEYNGTSRYSVKFRHIPAFRVFTKPLSHEGQIINFWGTFLKTT